MCSVVRTKDGRVVASPGDPDAEVNRGLNCIKGYFQNYVWERPFNAPYATYEKRSI